MMVSAMRYVISGNAALNIAGQAAYILVALHRHFAYDEKYQTLKAPI